MPTNKKMTKEYMSRRNSLSAKKFLRSCEDMITVGELTRNMEVTYNYFYRGKTISITVKVG